MKGEKNPYQIQKYAYKFENFTIGMCYSVERYNVIKNFVSFCK